ncbi:MAG: DUF2817 domain-containing protein [Planctomycetota bacterium]
MARPITDLSFPITEDIGHSVEKREIALYQFVRRKAPALLILGGMHGDEPKGVSLARYWLDLLIHDSELARSLNWMIILAVNPDGLLRRKRRNSRQVDLNRNFPTRNWKLGSRQSRMYGGPEPASEPETRAVISVVESCRPNVILTLHSIGANRYCNNYDGPARRLAHCLRRVNGYPVTKSIGYPTPGSFGTWAGIELGIPTITLELPSHHSPRICLEENRNILKALAATLKFAV